MSQNVVLISVPGLRNADLGSMSRLMDLTRRGDSRTLVPSFPALTGPVQANLTTGVGPEQHGVVADRFYARDSQTVERWTAWNRLLQHPQIWETLKQRDPSITSALWFPRITGTVADIVCSVEPIRNPGGRDSLSLVTRPVELQEALHDALGDFPLENVPGPLPSIRATAWMVDSFVQTAYAVRPRFSYVSLPHLENTAQKFGPQSDELLHALGELDMAIGALVDGFTAAGFKQTTWLIASEYVITPVSRVGYPNRVLRQAGLLSPKLEQGSERLFPRESRAFAVADHQLAHVYVNAPADVPKAAEVLRQDPTVADVLVGDERAKVGLNHPHSGEIVIASQPDAWFADHWWLDDALAPAFDLTLGNTPADPALVKGSHGLVSHDAARQGLLVCSDANVLRGTSREGLHDVDVAALVQRTFGVQ